MSKKIWPNDVVIDVLGVTGELWSGKTLFACSIDPANTRQYDFEKSAGSYGGLGVDRVDVPTVMMEAFAKSKKPYTPMDVFVWWYNDIKKLEPGQFSVVVADPVSDIEDGLVEWVKSRHKEWGFKTADAFYSTGGIFWSKVKSEWKRVLADLSSRCETFVFTTHLKKIWKHGKPTKLSEPKGKSTLMELSSLFLYLERPSEQMVPSANVLKSRLAITSIKNGEVVVVPCLPPRIEVATPKQIREYIVTPPDYDNLKEDEVEKERELSEADKLELEREIAADKRAAEEASLKAAETHKNIQSARELAMQRLQPKKEESKEGPKEEPQQQAAKEEPKEEVNESPIDPSPEDKLTQEEAAAVVLEIIESGHLVDVARAVYKKLSERGVDMKGFTNPDCLESYLIHLSVEEAEGMKKWMKTLG